MTGGASRFARPFGEAPATPESIIAHVYRELVADDGGAVTRPAGELDLVAETSVRHLWGGRVTAFVSVLALRDAREALRAQGGAADRPGARIRSTSLDEV